MGGLLKWSLKAAVKGGLVGGAVYGTAKYGVWEKADKSKVLYEDLKANIPFKEELQLEKVGLPDWKWESFGDSWNKGVVATFTWLADSPSHLKRLAGVGWETAKELTYSLMTINEQDTHSRTAAKS